jgi:hypothetical protein
VLPFSICGFFYPQGLFFKEYSFQTAAFFLNMQVQGRFKSPMDPDERILYGVEIPQHISLGLMGRAAVKVLLSVRAQSGLRTCRSGARSRSMRRLWFRGPRLSCFSGYRSWKSSLGDEYGKLAAEC